MLPIPADIFTEPEDVSPDGLANLGPLRRLAGSWQADKGIDINPKAEGPERRTFIERIRMDPIDPQANGPQLLYGLRYHIHINTPEEDITFHDQVGYWLWEPATGLIMQTLAIPRGQVLLASGKAGPDDKKISRHREARRHRLRDLLDRFPGTSLPHRCLPLRHHLQRRRQLELSDPDRVVRARRAVQPSRQQHAEARRAAEAQSARGDRERIAREKGDEPAA